MLKNNLRVQIQKKMPSFSIEANFEIPAEKRASLVSSSGSGKSTLLKLIAGLLPLDRGRIFLGSQDLTPLPPAKRNIGYLFQESALFPSLNVIENIAFGLLTHQVKKKEAMDQSFDFLKKISLEHLAYRNTESLSGGEKQRISFLRAFIWKPSLLLLDEPFSSLDTENKDLLKILLLELHKEHPVPLLLVTHDLQEAQELTHFHFTLKGDTHRSLLKL